MKSIAIAAEARHRARWGFTLVELLVVIGILVLLTSLVVVAIQTTRGSDRARSAGRTAQSAFLGARDRAIHAKEQRGIRMNRDPQSPNIVNGFEYIRALPSLSYGKQPGSSEIQIERETGFTDATRVIGSGSAINWRTLRDDGFFGPTARIRIPSKTGRWYKVQSVLDVGSAPNAEIRISPFDDPDSGYTAPNPIAVPATSEKATCDIELGNEVLPFSQIITMTSGIVIDLNWSQVAGRTRAQLTDPSLTLEMMFSPRGGMAGTLAALGPLHFLITDLQDAASVDPNDATLPLSPIHPTNRGEKMVLTVFPLTGNVTVSPIDPTDADNDGLADDLFAFARRGQVSN